MLCMYAIAQLSPAFKLVIKKIKQREKTDLFAVV